MKLTDEEREWKKLAIARYQLFPTGLKLCVGRNVLTNEQAIQEIQKESEIGKILVRVEKYYLQSLKHEDWSEYEKSDKPTNVKPHGERGRFCGATSTR